MFFGTEPTSIIGFFRRTLDFLLPASCSYCRNPVAGSGVPRFCSHCWSDFTPVPGPVCPSCGRPFGSASSLAYSPEHECLACRTRPPHFDQALAAGLFEGPLREAIHVFKYRPVRSLGEPLAAWMAAQMRITAQLDLVMPVPLHRERLLHRGFNQALILAYGVAERFSIPLCYDNLIRLRSTRPQVELSVREREVNVQGAFGILRPAEVQDKRILLIDDVFTTGATMNECAKVLKACGTKTVSVLTLARPVD